MTWQENLFSNLLVVGILVTLMIILYLKIANKTLSEFIREIKEMFSTPEE